MIASETLMEMTPEQVLWCCPKLVLSDPSNPFDTTGISLLKAVDIEPERPYDVVEPKSTRHRLVW
jgi:hypothetical protein